tara:strand:- start:4954 stop:5142 length:189 start_codon:yes stop_codon:yes gene_type:complete
MNKSEMSNGITNKKVYNYVYIKNEAEIAYDNHNIKEKSKTFLRRLKQKHKELELSIEIVKTT